MDRATWGFRSRPCLLCSRPKHGSWLNWHMGGVGRGRPLDDVRKSQICEHIRNRRFLRTAADTSTSRAVSSRAQRAKASESQPAQRSEQDRLARRRAKRAARVPRAKRVGQWKSQPAQRSEQDRLPVPPSRAVGGFPFTNPQFLSRITIRVGPSDRHRRETARVRPRGVVCWGNSTGNVGFPITNYSTPTQLGPVDVASRRVQPMAWPVCHKRGSSHELALPRAREVASVGGWSHDRPQAQGIPRLSVVWRTSSGCPAVTQVVSAAAIELFADLYVEGPKTGLASVRRV